MDHGMATGHSFVPPLVMCQVCGDDGEAIHRCPILHHGLSQRLPFRKATNGAADTVARLQKLQHDMLGDEPRCTGDHNPVAVTVAHDCLFPLSPGRSYSSVVR